jgi:hypothetical protein
MTSPAGTLRRVHGWHPPLMTLAAVMVAMAGVSAVGLAADPRVLVGAPIWLKPFKFAVSIAVYAVSWGWLLSWMGPRNRRRAGRLATVLVGLFALEYVIIVLQVARGQLSHFNDTTPFNATLFGVMGTSIVVIWVGSLVLSWMMLSERVGDRATTRAVQLGALLSVAGGALGALMVGPTADQRAAMSNGTFDGVMGAHSVGADDGGPVMPITGWNTEVGDLRVPHFFGLHALQAIPLVLLALTLLGRRVPALADVQVRARLVWVAAGGYLAVMALLVWQAERGQSVIHPDGLTLGVLAVVVLGVVAAATVVLRRPSVQQPVLATGDAL